MNPVARTMKQYIKTPLKYALPLLLIGALVLVSMSGCLSRTGTSSSVNCNTDDSDWCCVKLKNKHHCVEPRGIRI